MWDRHDPLAIDEFVDPGFVHHNPPMGQDAGRDGLQRTLAAVFAAFPEVQLTHEDLIGEGDKIVDWDLQRFMKQLGAVR